MLRFPGINVHARDLLGASPLLHLFGEWRSNTSAECELQLYMGDLLIRQGARVDDTTQLYFRSMPGGRALHGGDNLATCAARNMTVLDAACVMRVFDWMRQRGVDLNHMNGHGHVLFDFALSTAVLSGLTAMIPKGLNAVVPRTIPGSVNMTGPHPAVVYASGGRLTLPSLSQPPPFLDDKGPAEWSRTVVLAHQASQQAQLHVQQELSQVLHLTPLCDIVLSYGGWMEPDAAL